MLGSWNSHWYNDVFFSPLIGGTAPPLIAELVAVHYNYPSTGIKPVLSGTLTKGRTPSSKLMNIKMGREQAQKTSHLSEYVRIYIYIYKISTVDETSQEVSIRGSPWYLPFTDGIFQSPAGSNQDPGRNFTSPTFAGGWCGAKHQDRFWKKYMAVGKNSKMHQCVSNKWGRWTPWSIPTW